MLSLCTTHVMYLHALHCSKHAALFVVVVVPRLSTVSISRGINHRTKNDRCRNGCGPSDVIARDSKRNWSGGLWPTVAGRRVRERIKRKPGRSKYNNNYTSVYGLPTKYKSPFGAVTRSLQPRVTVLSNIIVYKYIVYSIYIYVCVCNYVYIMYIHTYRVRSLYNILLYVIIYHRWRPVR